MRTICCPETSVKIPTTRCLITQKSAVLIYFAEGARIDVLGDCFVREGLRMCFQQGIPTLKFDCQFAAILYNSDECQ